MTSTRIRIAVGFVLIGVVLWFAYRHRSDITPAATALENSSPWWLAVGGGFMVVWLIAVAALHWTCRRAVGFGSEGGFLRMLPLTTAATALNIVIKVGNVAGLGLFVADARKTGKSSAQVSAAYLLAMLMTNLAFAFPIVTAVAFAATFHKLTLPDLIAVGLCFIATCGIGAVTALSLYDKRILVRIYSWPIRTWDRLRRRPVRETIDTTTIDELYDAVQLARAHPKTAAAAFGWAILIEHAGVAMLWASLAAVGGGEHLIVALVGYVMSTAFSAAGIIPGGLGLAELGAASVLIAFGAPIGIAGAAVLIYRCWSCWFPAIVGLGVAFVLRRRTASGSDLAAA